MSVVNLATPADVISVLKDHGFDDYNDNQFLTIINEIQNEVCALEPWPLLEFQYIPATSAGNPAITFVANMVAILSLVNTTTGDTLIPERWDVINKNYSNMLTQQGAPQYYYFKGENVFLYPVPDQQYAYLAGIQIQPTQLTTTGDAFTWPARHLWVIVYGALVRLFEMEDDENNAQFYQNRMDSRLTRAREDLWTRQYDRFDSTFDVMQDDWYGW